MLILLLLAMWMPKATELAGLWTLQSITQNGQESRDPRWTCWLEFDSDGKFFLSSTMVIEKHGTKPAQQEIKLAGMWRLESGVLVLTLKDLNDEQAEFARVNLGRAEKGIYRPGLSFDGGLVLDSGTRKLVFRRHEKPAP